ncbi:MAG: ABC transporter ATP-binding protein [candidate division Zixibacteria bacterium]|nr:ABC transporter ATP-binding protein [candidate division Zixibacteria bacterium]
MNKTASQIIRSYLYRYKSRWLWGFLTVFLSTAFSMISPWVLRQAINALQEGVTTEKLVTYAIIIIVATIIQGIFLFYMRQTMIVASRMIEYDLRNDLFAQILKLDRPYFDKTPTGELMARMTNDLDAVRNMIGPGIMYFANTVFTFGMAFILMIIINVKLTVVAFLPLPFITITTYFLGREVHKRYLKIQEQYARITTEVQENLSGIRVIKAYVQEENEIKRFGRLNRDYIKKNLQMVKIWGMIFPVVFGFAGLSIALVLWIGGNQVINKAGTLGDLVAFTAYLMLLLWPVAALGWVIGLYQRGMASMKRIAEIFNANPQIPSPIENNIKYSISGKIEFRNLSFAYGEKTVLHDISLMIPAGATVAILGHTGSGKTSLVSLIPRLYPIRRGMLFIDDKDINDIDIFSLRSQIGLVAQETFLFSQTIEDNISLGRLTSKYAVGETASIASIADDINGFPSGFKTLIGERGITLSGGQRQRTALARALAINPKILILDDAFSSVDTATEENILTNLRQVMGNCTSLIISHRVSTVKNADLIVVLENGRIAESGNHDQLLQKGGLYAVLHERQLLKQELEAL